MNLWKEKVTDKLARLLADSPLSPSSTSPVSQSESQNTQFTPGEFTSPKKSSFSYMLSFLPSPAGNPKPNDSNSNPNSPSASQTLNPKTDESLSTPWPSFKFENVPLELNSSSESETETEKENGNGNGNKNVDLKFKNGIEEKRINNSNYLNFLSDKSVFVTMDLFEFFESSLPSIVKGSHWVLLYSTWKNGISLQTLLRNSLNLPGPCLLIVGDLKGAIFGGLLDCPLKPTPRRKYQGTNQTFVFTTKYGNPRLFRPTGANRYFYLCLNDTLAFGGGGNFAICLDEDLLHGTSGACETFGNECLAHDSDFELKNVELWGFTYSSRHIS
ncbi:hypothetical protein LUZ60_002340 [Juncus effusus]|nr:hypothetical protein LUZ60_002340 [Juncus effusus]